MSPAAFGLPMQSSQPSSPSAGGTLLPSKGDPSSTAHLGELLQGLRNMAREDRLLAQDTLRKVGSLECRLDAQMQVQQDCQRCVQTLEIHLLDEMRTSMKALLARLEGTMSHVGDNAKPAALPQWQPAALPPQDLEQLGRRERAVQEEMQAALMLAQEVRGFTAEVAKSSVSSQDTQRLVMDGFDRMHQALLAGLKSRPNTSRWRGQLIGSQDLLPLRPPAEPVNEKATPVMEKDTHVITYLEDVHEGIREGHTANPKPSPSLPMSGPGTKNSLPQMQDCELTAGNDTDADLFPLTLKEEADGTKTAEGGARAEPLEDADGSNAAAEGTGTGTVSKRKAKAGKVASGNLMQWADYMMAEEDETVEHSMFMNILIAISDSTAYATVSMFMIIINTAFMGTDTHIKVTDLLDRVNCIVDPLEPMNEVKYNALNMIEYIFFAWMGIELFVHTSVLKVKRYADWEWCVFDATIFLTSAFNILMASANLSVLRLGKIYKLLKIFRVGKAFKVLRLIKFLAGVRKMVLSVVGSLSSMFWAMIIIVVIMYIVSIVFLQGIETYAEDLLKEAQTTLRTGSPRSDVCPKGTTDGSMFYTTDEGDTQALQLWYGGLGSAMLTLFRSISGGAEWALVAEPIVKVNPAMYLTVWLCFIAFMIFGVLNILTGVFCDAAMKAATENEEFQMQELKEEMDHAVQMLKEVFNKVDADGSGLIGSTEFSGILRNPMAQAQFQILDINPGQCEGLFSLLDVDDSDSVDVDEFINGCLKLRGGAKAVDISTLLHENKKIRLYLKDIEELLVSFAASKTSKEA